MALSLQPYLKEVRNALDEALCLHYFPSPVVERHSKPEVEIRTTEAALLTPVKINRSANEFTLVEPSVNSCRISIKIKQLDDLDSFLSNKFARFMEQRAENFQILRRKPVQGYDLSFLVVHKHTESLIRAKLVDFIIQFMEEVDREISEMKINVNARARMVAESWLKSFE